jgi:hypothetical protein
VLRSLRIAVLALLAACAPGVSGGGTPDAAPPPPHDGSTTVDAPVTMNCDPNAPDLEGCSCTASSAPHACYPATAMGRHTGACKDGMQTCTSSGEFAKYGPCTGAVTPVGEICNNGIDDSCDGKTDCADPTCATNTVCMSACTSGMTRSCYDGPPNTAGVGSCKMGTQTCTNGNWPTNCPGEVLPQPEDCTAFADKNCNYLPGCFDFSCITSPACNSPCKLTKPGCVCPQGAGDVATCPAGMVGIDIPSGTFGQPDSVECCPCTSDDCGNAVCCAEAVCAGDSRCASYTCTPLPAMCNGTVNFDCDDFPEDCDEPCCPCSTCNNN